MSLRRGRGHDATGRARRDAQHVRLHVYMLQSDAWRSLTCYARAALIELYALFNGTNNGKLFMSERELARRLGASRGTARTALAELVGRGFIVTTERGGFVRKIRHATCWRLTEHECDGTPPTKEFLRWHSDAKIAASMVA